MAVSSAGGCCLRCASEVHWASISSSICKASNQYCSCDSDKAKSWICQCPCCKLHCIAFVLYFCILRHLHDVIALFPACNRADTLSCTRCNITCSMFAAILKADALAVRLQACKAMSFRRYWRPNCCWLSRPTLPHTPWRTCWHAVHLTIYIRHHPQPTQIPS